MMRYTSRGACYITRHSCRSMGSSHASSRAIVAKAFRAGFYCLATVKDVKDIVHRCEACQRFASRPHALAAELQPIPLSWPFVQWGLDIVGKLHKSWPGRLNG
jgi:hypothetical protein